MISYTVYKVIHLTGIFTFLLSLGGVLFQRLNGGELTRPSRRRAAIGHGIGIVLILLGGFGMLARIGIRSDIPLWVWGKVAIWLFFAVELSIVLRKPALASLMWWATLSLAIAAAYLGLFHPFSVA